MRRRQTEALLDARHFKPTFELPEMETAVGRVIDSYDRATSWQREVGLEWYSAAHDVALEMVQEFPDQLESVSSAAGLIAVLSANTDWERNVANAWLFLKTGKAPTLPRSLGYAASLTDGVSPDDVIHAAGQNFKIRNFHLNITDPNEIGPITIDRHAKGLIHDDPKAVNMKPHTTRSDYEFYSGVIFRAAFQLGIKPHDVQAITWLEWKKESPLKSESSTQLAL